MCVFVLQTITLPVSVFSRFSPDSLSDNNITLHSVSISSRFCPDSFSDNNIALHSVSIFSRFSPDSLSDNNIALIKLDSPVTLNDCVQPLPRFARNAAQCSSSLMNCTITGWGQFDGQYRPGDTFVVASADGDNLTVSIGLVTPL